MNTMVPIQLPSMPRRKGLDVKAFCTLAPDGSCGAGVSNWLRGKYKSSLHVLILLRIEMGKETADWKELQVLDFEVFRLIRYQGEHFKET